MNTVIYLALLALSVHHFFWFRDTLGYTLEISLGLTFIAHLVSVAFWKLVLAKLPDFIDGIFQFLLIGGAAILIGFVLVILTGHTQLLLDVIS